LKLKYDEPLSKFAFNFNLRRYTKEAIDVTHAFLDRLFPRIPIHPFMMLLLQLNQVSP